MLGLATSAVYSVTPLRGRNSATHVHVAFSEMAKSFRGRVWTEKSTRNMFTLQFKGVLTTLALSEQPWHPVRRFPIVFRSKASR